MNFLLYKELIQPYSEKTIRIKKRYRSSVHLILSFIFLFEYTSYALPPETDHTLSISKEDLLIQESTEGGYHLWIRKKPGINSVLLTESSNDPQKKITIYALRTLQYNPINGDEKRLINGRYITNNIGIIDSTPEPHPLLGEAFHLFIPYLVEYGYAAGRNGQIQVTVGSFLNIKAFARPFADWAGAQQDNPFVLTTETSLEQTIKPTGKYLEDTVKEFKTISDEGGGKSNLIPENKDIIDKIQEILEQVATESLDLVIALDTTLSMTDELPYLKKELVPSLVPFITRFNKFRLGICYYRDYYEQYLTKPFAFTENLNDIQKIIDQARPFGGREIPEAVHEALDSCLDFYPWAASTRYIFLIGDAPPHPLPHDNSITRESIILKAKDKSVMIHTFILTVD